MNDNDFNSYGCREFHTVLGTDCPFCAGTDIYPIPYIEYKLNE